MVIIFTFIYIKIPRQHDMVVGAFNVCPAIPIWRPGMQIDVSTDPGLIPELVS